MQTILILRWTPITETSCKFLVNAQLGDYFNCNHKSKQ